MNDGRMYEPYKVKSEGEHHERPLTLFKQIQ